MHYKHFFCLILFVFNSIFLFSEDKKLISYYYPVDTLLVKDNLGPFQKITLNMIREWQTKSYHNPSLNCQFYPSCSNHCAINIYNHGAFKGVVIGLDRFFRCNRSAPKYYKIYNDDYIIFDEGRLSDEIIRPNNKKNVFLGMALSAAIPGMGRAYYGRYRDGWNVFKHTTPLLASSYLLYQQNFNIISALFGVGGLLLWITDFYGIYNLSKEYNK